MQYLAMVYYIESAMAELSQDSWDALNQECINYGSSLKDSGQMLDGRPLMPVETATTVRVRDGKVTVTDGPFAETREQLAGFYLLEARDLNQAIQLASKIPPARYGCVEVRPVRELRTEGNEHYQTTHAPGASS